MRSDGDMEIDPEASDSRVDQKRMLTQIVAIPATLYFPTSIVAELNEICKSLGYTPEQLVIEALKGQIDYWNEFYEHVMTLPVEPEDLVWPKDPVFCLACVTTVHIINNFARCSHDPVASRNSMRKRPVNGHSALWKKMSRSTTPTGGKRSPKRSSTLVCHSLRGRKDARS